MNHFTVTSVSIFLCLAMTLSLCRAGSAEEQTLLQKLPLRIHNKTLTQSEYLACQRAAQTSKQFTHEFRVQTATIQREFFGNPAKSIDCIASDLFSPELYQQWHSENIAAYTDRLKHYQKECSVWRQNKRQNPKTDLTPPIPPHTIQQDLPSISQWRITPQSAPAAMEAARCLHHVGKTQSALAIIDFIGQNSDVIGRIFASECLGDIFVDQHFFEKALTAYNHALRFNSDHEQQFSPGEIEKNSTFNQQIAPLVQRIQQKRSALLKQIERDRYGEDWTAYRDAEVARKTNQHFFHAIESYQIVQHISQESMFQDAAEFGIIQCFFSLATQNGEKRLEEEKKLQKYQLSEIKKKLQNLQKLGASATVLSDTQTTFQKAQKRLQAIERCPTGKLAESEGFQRAQTFIKKERNGLYRGETLLVLGNFYLESRLNIKKAIQYFEEATQWCDDIKQFDQTLQSIPIPSRSATISKPPQSMRPKDNWGNRNLAIPQPGQLFNRRTAHWYLPYLRILSGTQLGLAYFLDHRSEEALNQLWVITAFDQFEKENHQVGLPNSDSRLRKAFTQGYFFASLEDLAHFKEPLRTELIIADYYYELEIWHEAKNRYKAFHEKYWKQLDEVARAYLTLVEGHCEMLTVSRKSAHPYFKQFETKYRKTPSWHRAQSVLVSYYLEDKNNPEMEEKAAQTLRNIYNEMPNTDKGHHSLSMVGLVYYSWGHYEKAIEAFEYAMEKCPEYKNAILHYLNEIKQKQSQTN